MLERELRAPVHAWLVARGMTPVYELLLGGYCDMVGLRFAERVGRPIPALLEVVAVELKLVRIAEVLDQAKNNRPHAHESYAAMPADRCARMLGATLAEFERAGVGLLSIGDVVDVMIKPVGTPEGARTEWYRKRWWARMRRDERRQELPA